jgi:hypothetical protein
MAGAALRDAVADQRMVDTPSLLAYLPWLLRYPLAGHALPALLLFTGLLWIGLQSILGIALLAIVSPWLLRYAEHIVERTAAGQATPPMFGGEQLYLEPLALLRSASGPLLVASAWFAAADAGARTALLVVAALLLPAYMLVLATHRSLVALFNPLAWIGVIAALGLHYLPLAAVLAMVVGAVLLVADRLAFAGALAVLIYAWLFSCHVIGFVLFHRAERFGLTPSRAQTSAEIRSGIAFDQRLARVLAQVDAAIDKGQLQAAADALLADAGPADAQRRFHEALFEALQSRRRAPLLLLQGARLVDVLIGAKQAAAAVDVAEICLDAHHSFAPGTLAQAIVLADEALRSRRGALLERLLAAARARFTADDATASLAFIEARYHMELRDDAARAREVLAPALRRTGHPQHAQIMAYARALAKMR